MKWQLKEPVFGDIIRVKAGSIYHYGIYVSDEEVVQFGLSPALRTGVSEAEVEVCTSSIDDFLLGGFLEIGVSEKKDKKRYPPKKTVELARGRIGEKGYNIVHNNCEHFAWECYFGQKVSLQTESIREVFRSLPLVDVYVAQIPQRGRLRRLYPRERQCEIKRIKNKEVKREKYYVWKLLEHAVKNSFNKKIKEYKFAKNQTGKWQAEGMEFSISHSHGVVCVAVSRAAVGVDVEKVGPTRVDISSRVLSASELEKYNSLNKDQKTQLVIDSWTKKESLFKAKNVKSVSFEEFRALDGRVYQKTLTVNGERFSLCVATDRPDKVRLYEGIVLE